MNKGLAPITRTGVPHLLLVGFLALLVSGCAELANLRTENEQQDREIAQLKKERDEFKKAYYDVVGIRENEGREAAATRDQIQREKQEVEAELTQVRDQAEADRQKLQADLNREKVERARLQNELHATAEKAKTELAEAREIAQKMEAEANANKERAETAEASVEQANAERDLVRKELEALQQRAASAESSLSEAQQQLTEAQAALKEQQQVSEELEKTAARQNGENEKLKQELVRLRTETLKAPVSPNESVTSGAATEKQPGPSAALPPDQAEAIAAQIKKGLDAEKISKVEYNVSRDRGSVVVRLSSDWLFQEQSVLVSESGAKGLGTIADVLNHHPDLRVRVEGHTDSLPVRNLPFPDNWGLASARADSVVRWLETEGKVAGKRLVAVGRSRYDSIADNNTPEGRKKNRRVELWLLPPAD